MNKHTQKRRGAATVEFAITAPVLFLLLFGAYELSRANMMMHTVEAAAYEGARVAIVPGATADEVEEAANAVLATIGIQGADIEVQPRNLSNESETVNVQVDVAFADNSLMAPIFVGDLEFSRNCELFRESD